MASTQDSSGDGSAIRGSRSEAARHVVVDGSNLATEGRSLPSLMQLDEAVRAYRTERPDEEIIVVVDASFGYRIDESERAVFEEAEEAGEIVSPPAGAIGRGDKFLLQIADRIDAVVLSNDSFQEFHGEYPWLFDEGRLIGGKPVPVVGWIFTARTPVRGPKSRVAVRDAEKKRRTRSEPVRAAIAEATVEAVLPGDAKAERPRGRRRSLGTGSPEAINDPLPFIAFIAGHPLGSQVEGEVDSFTSHGAFVLAGGARCYAPVSGLADPPPKSAKELLTRGEVRTFVVQALDAPRRGIELALPGLARIAGAPTAETVEAEIDVGSQAVRRRRRPARTPPPDAEEGLAEEPSTEPRQARPLGIKRPIGTKRAIGARRPPAETQAPTPEPAVSATAAIAGTKAVTVRKSPAKAVAKKAAAPKATKAATKKRAGTKKAASQAAASEAAATKTAATKAAASEAAATKAAASEAAATKAAASEAAATKAAATKTAATKTAATKTAATKTAATKTAATKTAATKTAATKTAATKTAATKTAATKTAATKTAATKTAATKTPVKKAATTSKAATTKKAAAKNAAAKNAAAKNAAARKVPATKAGTATKKVSQPVPPA